MEENATVYLNWAETLMKYNFFHDALIVAKTSLFRKSENINLSLNTNLWSLYIDLELKLGTFETQKLAYKRMVHLKVITPFILLNYAQLLENNFFYEESFKIYESGIALFSWPGLYDIWIIYLHKFI